ncbi:MAG TPA: hypothetical protein VHO06_12620 [Polyangia bacterium]|nr:hypothetical protein [Polyangia bacterium]
MDDHDRATFADHEPPPHERRADKVSAQLLSALQAVAAFAADYQREHSNQTVVAVGSGGARLPVGQTWQTRQLLRVVEEHLPDLDPRVQDTERNVRLVGDRPRPRRPGWFSFLEPGPGGWLVKRRGRVVSLMSDQVGYWKRFGLSGPANRRTMACASLLLGSWPKLDGDRLRRLGYTVAEVFELEENAIRAQGPALVRLTARREKKTPAIG